MSLPTTYQQLGLAPILFMEDAHYSYANPTGEPASFPVVLWCCCQS
jgi:hypothetical protein